MTNREANMTPIDMKNQAGGGGPPVATWGRPLPGEEASMLVDWLSVAVCAGAVLEVSPVGVDALVEGGAVLFEDEVMVELSVAVAVDVVGTTV
jgi:hypothetical protein